MIGSAGSLSLHYHPPLSSTLCIWIPSLLQLNPKAELEFFENLQLARKFFPLLFLSNNMMIIMMMAMMKYLHCLSSAVLMKNTPLSMLCY